MSKKKNCRKYFIIYETTNLTNSKIYVGKHWSYTPYEFDGYLGSGKAIKAAIKKYGKENFVRKTLFVFETEVEVYVKEKEIVTPEFVKRKDTYNLREGGEGGWECSEETREKMSESGKGKVFTEEHRKNIGVANSGVNSWLFGKTGEEHPFFGREHSEEVIEKMRVAKIGHIVTEETREKIRVALTGTHLTQETKDKISIAMSGENNPMSGKQHTLEAIEKISGENHWNFGGHLSYESRRNKAISHLGEEVFYQRLKDIEEIDRGVRGYIVELGRKWGIARNNAGHFVKCWYKKE